MDVSMTQKTPLAQFHSEVEPENGNEKEPKKNVTSNDPHTTYHSSPRKRKQKVTDSSMQGFAVNETPTEQSNVEVEPEIINHKIDKDVPLKKYSTNKYYKNQQMVSDKIGWKNTTAPRKCPQKWKGDQVTVSTLAKKPKNLRNLPADPVSFIAKHTHSPPEMSALTKLTLINECIVLYLKPIPKPWLYNNNKMKEFMRENIDRTVAYTVLILRDAKFDITGECLIKFSNPDHCHKAWFDLRGVTIYNKPVSVHIDMGHTILKQACKKDRLERKHLIFTHNPEGPTENVYKFTTQEYKNVDSNTSDVANSNNNENSATESKSIGLNSLAGDSVLLARIKNNPFYKTDNNNKKNSDGNLYNVLLQSLYAINDERNIINGKKYNKKAINHRVEEKPPCMPLEKFDESNYYGLSEEFLQFLGLKLPLRNLIIVKGLDNDMDDDKLIEVFSLAGAIKRAYINRRNIWSDIPTCRGFIEYDHPLEAVQAISMFHKKKLNGRILSVTMTEKSTGLHLPEGLTEVGPGLGLDGEPLRGARVQAELQSSKKMLNDFRSEFEDKMRKFEKTAAAHNAKIDFLIKKVERMISKVPEVSAPLLQQIDAASQLINSLSSLVHPNIMMALINLLSAQGLVQQGMGVNQTDSVNAMQSQIMLQNENYAQNVDTQGMTPQLFLPVNPHPFLAQPELAQSQLTQTMEQPQLISAPQTYYGQPQIVQPDYVPMQTVPSPTPVAHNHTQNADDQSMIPQPTLPGDWGLAQPQLIKPMEQPQIFSTQPYYDQPQIVHPGFVRMPSPVSVPQVNSPQLPPQNSYPDQTQPASSLSQAQIQQTPKVVHNESSENDAQSINVQGMTQSKLPGDNPQLGLDQPQFLQPMEMEQPQPASSFSQSQNKQTAAHTPKLVQNESSNNQATDSNWGKMPVTAPVAQKQKAAKRKPTSSSKAQ